MTREQHDYLGKELGIPSSLLPPFVDTPPSAPRVASHKHTKSTKLHVTSAVPLKPAKPVVKPTHPTPVHSRKAIHPGDFPVFMFAVLTVMAILILIMSKMGGLK